ncbi:MAG: MFS transporter [Acetobacteraceae bacterium]
MTRLAPAADESAGSPYWRQNLFVCLFGSFSTIVAMTLLLPFLPLYVADLGVKTPQAVVQWSGVAFGATFFGAALVSPLWGKLADRYGRKPILIRASLGMAITMSLIGMVQNVYQLVGAAAAGRARRRLLVGLDRADRHADAEAPRRLGAGHAVDRRHGRQPGRPADRRRPARADRRARDVLRRGGHHLPGLSRHQHPHPRGQAGHHPPAGGPQGGQGQRLDDDPRPAARVRDAADGADAHAGHHVHRADHHRVCRAVRAGQKPGDADRRVRHVGLGPGQRAGRLPPGESLRTGSAPGTW